MPIIAANLIDPTLNVLVQQAARQGEELWVPLLLELKEGATLEEFRRLSDTLGADVKIPSLYARSAGWAQSARYLTARVRLNAANKRLLQGDAWADLLSRYEIGLPQGFVNVAGPSVPPAAAVTGASDVVVAAVIDDSLAFAHGRFCTPQGQTRFDWVWDQRGPLGSNGNYGRVLDSAAINALLAQHRRYGQVDETALYRSAGYESFDQPGTKAVSRRIAHGTHVADLAFGGTFTPGEAMLHRVAVVLPREVTADTTGGMLGPYVLDGLRAIVQHARNLGQRVRGIVVNLSYGIYQGPHDGTGLVETAFDTLIAAAAGDAPLHLVLPTGNHRQVRCHAEDSVAPGATSDRLVLRVQPDDRTPSLVELWIDAQGNSAPTLQLSDPAGTLLPAQPVTAGTTFADPATAGQRIRIEHAGKQPANGRHQVLLRLGPTARDGGFSSVASRITSGRWTIRVHNPGTQPMAVAAWIARDDAPLNWPRKGRQTRFADPHYRRWSVFGDDEATATRAIGRLRDDDPPGTPAVTRRRNTINAIATGKASFVVGGARGDTARPAPYSALGAGPPRAPAHVGKRPGREIDYLAWSDTSRARTGVLAAGARSGARVALGGTSVAAPQVARKLLEDLLADRTVERPSKSKADATPPISRPVPVKRRPRSSTPAP